MHSGNQQDNDGVDLCTVVFLEFAQFHLGESNAFYIFLQESKISKFFRISWCPKFLSKTCFPPWSRAANWPAAISGQFLGVGIRPGHVGCGPGQRGGMGSILAKLPSSPWFLGKQRRNSEDLEIFFNSLMS